MEMEPLITAGAAVAFSVAGFLMSNKGSRPKANLRTTRSESDLRKMRDSSMGADAVLPKFSGAAAEAASALNNSKSSALVVPANSPRGFSRGLNIISTAEAQSNVLQRTSIVAPSLPTLLEEPEEQEEGDEQVNNEKNELKTNIETEKDINLEKEKEIKCDDEGKVINKTNSLFPTKTGPHIKEPELKLEQEKTSIKAKSQAIEWPHVSVRDLLEEDDSDEEDEIKYIHILPQTLLESKEEIISICPPSDEQLQNYAIPKAVINDDLEKEEEIERLRSLAETLLERERDLEVQMLEYYGLKEQQEAMKEMEQLLKTNSAEAKFLSSKVESLEEENERLKKQVLELEKVTNKLDKNKEKIKMLKKRLKSEDDNAKEKIALLRESIETLADKEDKSAADYEEMDRKLERVKQLEEEVNQLKKLNARLEEENSGLSHRLENVQFVASSTTKDHEEQVLEEASRLREMNEKLAQEVAQLRNEHCLSVEEVVYLRWLNACLRHELKNYNPSIGKGGASELNKSPSYHSKEKVKQLLQEYSNLGIDINETNLGDLDFGYSTSQAPSTLTSPSRQHGKHSKSKGHNVFGKIKKIVTGKGNSKADKDKDRDRMSLFASETGSVSLSDESSPSSSIMTVERFPRSEYHPRASLNVRSKGLEAQSVRSNSDLGSPDVRRGEPRRYHALHLDHPSIDLDGQERDEIRRLAVALNSAKPPSKN